MERLRASCEGHNHLLQDRCSPHGRHTLQQLASTSLGRGHTIEVVGGPCSYNVHQFRYHQWTKSHMGTQWLSIGFRSTDVITWPWVSWAMNCHNALVFCNWLASHQCKHLRNEGDCMAEWELFPAISQPMPQDASGYRSAPQLHHLKCTFSPPSKDCGPTTC